MRALIDNLNPRRSVVMRFLVRSWEYRHPQAWVAFRLICGLWNLFLGAVLLSYGYWGVGFVALAGSALIFWTAYGIYVSVQS
jgi:hypothetical protein